MGEVYYNISMLVMLKTVFDKNMQAGFLANVLKKFLYSNFR